MEDLTTNIRRLAEAVSLVAAALDELSAALEAAESVRCDAYNRAGFPFGATSAGRSIWRAFGERTTLN